MSAWLVSNFHINALVSWAERNNLELPTDTPTPAATMKMLVDENMRSLKRRYDEEQCAEWTADAATYRFKPVPQEELRTFIKKKVAERAPNMPRYIEKLPPMTANVVATQIIKACDCYDYQACETDDYETTRACAFVHAVRQAAIDAGGQEHGKLNDALLWGLD